MLAIAIRRSAMRAAIAPSTAVARAGSTLLSPMFTDNSKTYVPAPNVRMVFPFSTAAAVKEDDDEPKHQAPKQPKQPRDLTEEEPMIAHFKHSSSKHPLGLHSDPPPEPIQQSVYDMDKIQIIEQTHHPVKKAHERAAYFAVKMLRVGFDILSGYRGPGGAMKEKDWLHRCLFLETVAGVPGMVGGMWRHLRSLRSLRRDYGWIHTLLEEAENERMHLLIFLNMKRPGPLFRVLTVGAQGVFFTMFLTAYMVSPRTCHRFVGYLEEEAVKTYTCLLKDIEDGHVAAWQDQLAPVIAQNYYKLPSDATVLDMIKCIRADEANHRDVNHTFAGLDQKQGVSPFAHRID